MIDRNEAIRQIEERLGAEGSPRIAAEVLDILEDEGYVTFNASDGYVIQLPAYDDSSWWNTHIERAEERIVGDV